MFLSRMYGLYFFFFFFNDTATTEIYTLSLHDALPICGQVERADASSPVVGVDDAPERVNGERVHARVAEIERDRKSTRLNSSHLGISYAVFCLKKKNITIETAAVCVE